MTGKFTIDKRIHRMGSKRTNLRNADSSSTQFMRTKSLILKVAYRLLNLSDIQSLSILNSIEDDAMTLEVRQNYIVVRMRFILEGVIDVICRIHSWIIFQSEGEGLDKNAEEADFRLFLFKS
jgi:hypothetical protein